MWIREERIARRSEDSGGMWKWAELVLCAGIVVAWFCVNGIGHGVWWRSLPLFPKKLVEGVGLAGFGVVFLWVKSRAGRLRPTTSWEFRDLLFDVAFVIGGAACLVEAMQGR